jgi:hypothetical protein
VSRRLLERSDVRERAGDFLFWSSIGGLPSAASEIFFAMHPKDLSKTLASLVEDGFLASRGAIRATIYFFPDKAPDAAATDLVSGIAAIPGEGGWNKCREGWNIRRRAWNICGLCGLG